MRRIAETSLKNLQQERVQEQEALDKTLAANLKPTIKTAYLALRREARERPHLERNAAGMGRSYRKHLAKRLGVKEQTVSGYVQQMKDAGIIERDAMS